MSKYSELNSYVERLQHRLRLGAWLRGAAILAGTALTVTVALVLTLNQLAFPEHGVAVGRLAIFIALGVAAIFGIAVPLMGLSRARAVDRAEAANPELEQRLTTFEERKSNRDDPFWSCWLPIRWRGPKIRSRLRWFQTIACSRSVVRDWPASECWRG